MKLKLTIFLSLILFALSALAQTPKIDTVVFVHGAFADGSAWSKVIPILQKKGIKTISVQNPLSSLTDDVKAANRAIDNQMGNVLLVGHSWGGTVITEAGNNPKVAGLVYVAAFAPDAGQSSNESAKSFPASPGLATLKPDEAGYISLTEENLRTNFAQDLGRTETSIMTATQGPIAGKCFDEKVTTAAWKDKPNWYVVATKDFMIDPTLQQAMAKKMNAEVTTLRTSHVPMLSKPKEVAGTIMTALKKLNMPEKPLKSASSN